MKLRDVQPERLDTLPHDDAVARRIHRDILGYNRLMGNFRWMRRQLERELRPGDRLLEIGAGRGELLRVLDRAGLLKRAARVTAIDAICPRPAACPEGVDWELETAEAFGDYGCHNVIMSLLFLHQLSDAVLQELGRRWSEADVILAVEPRRHALAHQLCRASRLIGYSREGIGDGLTSIRAGFRGDELFQRLGLDAAQWRCHTDETLLGRYGLLATRRVGRVGDTCI